MPCCCCHAAAAKLLLPSCCCHAAATMLLELSVRNNLFYKCFGVVCVKDISFLIVSRKHIKNTYVLLCLGHCWCCHAGAARLVMSSCCCHAAAAKLLLPSCCCHDAATMLLELIVRNTVSYKCISLQYAIIVISLGSSVGFKTNPTLVFNPWLMTNPATLNAFVERLLSGCIELHCWCVGLNMF